MKLLLSTEALPDSDFPTLEHACRRRALAGLELMLGEGRHGIDASLCPIRQQEGEECVPDMPDAPIVWLGLPEQVSLSMLMIWAAEAHILRAGLLIRRQVAEVPLSTRIALLHGTDVEEAREAVEWAMQNDAYTAWDVDPHRRDREVWDAVLAITGPRLAHVRLRGAGPEAEAGLPESEGTGTLLARLALNGYDGTVSLAPSNQARLEMWEDWLLSRRGWGCGTAAEKKARAMAARNA